MTLWRRGLLCRLGYLVSAGFPVFDFFAVYIAAQLAFVTSGRFQDGVPDHYFLVIFCGALVVPAWFGRADIYRAWRGQSIFLELRQVSFAWVAFFVAMATLALMTKAGGMFSRVWMLHVVVIAWCFLMLSRFLVRQLLNWARANGYNARFVVLVGDAQRCRQAAQELAEAKWSGLEVIEQVDINKPGAIGRLTELFNSRLVDQLWLAMDLKDVDRVNAVQHVADPFPVQVMWRPDLVGLHLLNHRIAEVAGMPMVALQDKPLNAWASFLKEAEDRVLASLILTMVAVPMLLIVLGIKLTSPGPVLFAQKRHGVRGEVINVLKFRTMHVHKEDAVITAATKNDSRITPLGRFLRTTSLDELPQFINVLRGEMSIVGPRPHSVTQEKLFTDYYHLYSMRHKVKPGITGWAQINGLRGEISSPEMLRSRVEHDIYYLRNWSLWFDLYIIVRTAFKGWSGENVY